MQWTMDHIKEDIAEDTKALISILGQLILLIAQGHMLESVAELAVDLHQLVQRTFNKMKFNFKKLHNTKILVLRTLVDNYGDKALRANQNHQNQHLTKQPTNQKKIKMQCSHNLQPMERKEWTKTVMTMHQLLLNRNNQKLLQWIYLIWEVQILSQRQMDLVIY